MMSEKIPVPESEKELALVVREKGARSPEFQAWVADQESQVTTAEDGIRLSIKLARIYYHAGFREEALESLNENREPAYDQGGTLLAEIDALMDRMEAGEEL